MTLSRKDNYKKFAHLKNRARSSKLKESLIEYKGGCCAQCGYKKCLASLVFHHLDPSQKDFEISKQIRKLSLEDLKLETDKCILLCQNCHAETHSKIDQDNINKNIEDIKILAEKFNFTFSFRNQKLFEATNTNIKLNNCKTCLKKYKLQNKVINKDFCSRKCRLSYFHSSWPSNEELIELKKLHTYKELTKILGKSKQTILKKLNEIKLH